MHAFGRYMWHYTVTNPFFYVLIFLSAFVNIAVEAVFGTSLLITILLLAKSIVFFFIAYDLRDEYDRARGEPFQW